MCGKDGRRFGAAIAAAAALALSFALAAPASPSFAQSVTTRSVSSGKVWTDTGVRLRAGTYVTVTASGRIHFGSGRIDQVSPMGIPWGRQCSAIAARLARGTGWPARGLPCWSLIGRIGSGAPFEVGTRRTVRVALDGVLFLGVNDNYLGDNSGTWSAKVRPNASAAPPSSSAQTPTPIGGPAKHGSNNTVLVLIVLVVLAALIALAAYWRIAVARRRGAKAPEPPGSDERIMVTAAVASAPVAAARGGQAAAPETDEFVDVNIFQVDLLERSSLRVGYNYFPEGTVVCWKVTQERAPRATGEFVTNGGGSVYHFVTVPLETKLDANSDGAEVLFTWTIGDVPFRYSVKRDPG
jgi:hypothetical protein